MVLLALIAGAVVARWARGDHRARVTGAITAVLAAWLFPQRRDLASSVILAVLFGARE
jgi:hypothetical protein